VAADQEAGEVREAHLVVLVARRGGASEHLDLLAGGAGERGPEDDVAVAPRVGRGGCVGGDVDLREAELALEDLDLAGEELAAGVEDEPPGAGEVGVGRGFAPQAAEERLHAGLVGLGEGRAAHRQQVDDVGAEIGATAGAVLVGHEEEQAGDRAIGDGAEGGVLAHGRDDVREHGGDGGSNLGGVDRVEVGHGRGGGEDGLELVDQGLGLRGGEVLAADGELGVERAGGEQALEGGGPPHRDPARGGDDEREAGLVARGRAVGGCGEGPVGQQEQRGGPEDAGGEVLRGGLLAVLWFLSRETGEGPADTGLAPGELDDDGLARGGDEGGRRGSGGGQARVVGGLAGEEQVHAGVAAGGVEAGLRGRAGRDELGREGTIEAAHADTELLRHG
jgi:hypothetical protein